MRLWPVSFLSFKSRLSELKYAPRHFFEFCDRKVLVSMRKYDESFLGKKRFMLQELAQERNIPCGY